MLIRLSSETAPLLQNVSSPDETRRPPPEPTFTERLSSAVHEPFSALTKILLVVVLLLLLLCSVFIGLFAGAQHKLNRGRDDGNTPPTVTSTATATVSSPVTSVHTATSTVISTTTSISTTTVAVPAPVPTSAPEEVRDSLSLVHLTHERANIADSLEDMLLPWLYHACCIRSVVD